MADTDNHPVCKYGINCYRRNEDHLKQYSHPSKDNSEKDSSSKERHSSTSLNENDDGKTLNQNLSPIKRNRSKSKSPIPSCSKSDEHEDKLITEETMKKDVKNSKRSTDAEYINDKYDNKFPYSQEVEYTNLLKTPSLFIKNKFLVDMPDDFYQFWNFCKLNATNKQQPEHLFDKFDLELIGPFDVITGKFDNAKKYEPAEYLCHWRFYYDPPEFQSIFKKKNSKLHFGYWRDDRDNNCLIARNDSSKSCEFDFIADNIFVAVIHYLEKECKLSPFNRGAMISMKKLLEIYANDNQISLTTFSSKLKSRNLRTVCKTFHRAGLIVPYDRKTDIGYRQLQMSDDNLKKILNLFIDANGDQKLIDAAMEKLHPLITAANIGKS